MSRLRTPIRSLTLVAAWLLYACDAAPTAPPDTTGPGPTSPVSSGLPAEATSDPGGGPAVDPLAAWALNPGGKATGHDTRIARAILDLAEERKEIRP